MHGKKVIVFGANGKAGQEIVKQSLEKGHKVTAFVRDPSKFSLLHPNLEIVRGDAMNQESVSKAIIGQEVVISALGSSEPSHRLVFMHNLINAMHENKVRRIIAMGGIGALQANEHLKVYETPTFPREYVDVTMAHVRVLDALLTSRMDFTFVCPPMISSSEKTGNYDVQDTYPGKGWSVHVGDLADFIVHEITENKYVGKKVGISQSTGNQG
ncbi:MAG: SDR family oxidoreductase [Flavobacteriales bacterium]|nr:SDR family oxidoreductase [Flavobacteriales bacterium]